jgi:hypothetical protein
MVARSGSFFSRVLPITALLTLLLFKFENCAPPPQSQMSGTGEVRIVDQWGDKKVSFLSATVVVPKTQSALALQGLCVGSQEGQAINYQIIDLQEIPKMMAAGIVNCVMGGFELPVTDLHFDSCDSRLQVRAAREGDEIHFAETVIAPDCG